MGAYQAMDWQTLASASSNELVSRALWWTEAYSSGTLGASMRLVTDALVFIALGALLAVADPVSVVIVLTVLGVRLRGAALWRAPPPGEQRRRGCSRATSARRTALTQALGALREIRVLGHEAWFRAEVREASAMQAEAASQQAALGQVPRYAIEAVMLTVLVVVAGLRFALDGSAVDAIPLLAMFAAASVRLMPASTSLISNINTLRSTRFVLGELAEELRETGWRATPRSRACDIGDAGARTVSTPSPRGSELYLSRREHGRCSPTSRSRFAPARQWASPDRRARANRRSPI